MKTMKALVWEGPFQMAIKKVEKPRPKPSEVLIRTRSVGICGSDLEVYEGGFAQSVPPLILGHEACGTTFRGHSRCVTSSETLVQVNRNCFVFASSQTSPPASRSCRPLSAKSAGVPSVARSGIIVSPIFRVNIVIRTRW